MVKAVSVKATIEKKCRAQVKQVKENHLEKVKILERQNKNLKRELKLVREGKREERRMRLLGEEDNCATVLAQREKIEALEAQVKNMMDDRDAKFRDTSELVGKLQTELEAVERANAVMGGQLARARSSKLKAKKENVALSEGLGELTAEMLRMKRVAEDLERASRDQRQEWLARLSEKDRVCKSLNNCNRKLQKQIGMMASDISGFEAAQGRCAKYLVKLQEYAKNLLEGRDVAQEKARQEVQVLQQKMEGQRLKVAVVIGTSLKAKEDHLRRVSALQDELEKKNKKITTLMMERFYTQKEQMAELQKVKADVEEEKKKHAQLLTLLLPSLVAAML